MPLRVPTFARAFAISSLVTLVCALTLWMKIMFAIQFIWCKLCLRDFPWLREFDLVYCEGGLNLMGINVSVVILCTWSYLTSTHISLMSILTYKPCHTPHKYRHMHEASIQFTNTYLIIGCLPRRLLICFVLAKCKHDMKHKRRKLSSRAHCLQKG